MQRDILNVQLVAGVKVRCKHLPKMGIGTLTGESHRSGTAQVLRYSVAFPHSRTKTRIVTLAIEVTNLEVVQCNAT